MIPTSKIKQKTLTALEYFVRLTRGFPVRQIYGGYGHLFMLHRVVPDIAENRLWSNSYLEVTQQFLESVIAFFANKGYDFISFNQLSEYIASKRKFVIFTFDDGYKDNLLYALPVFEKYGVPFTVYVATSFPDKKAILWWYLLEDELLSRDFWEFSCFDKKFVFELKTKKQKEEAFGKIRELIVSKGASYDILSCIFPGKDLYQPVNELALSWKDLKLLAASPLVTIGAHTVSHPNLKILNYQSAYNEIAKSKQILEAALNIEVKHFAYPFGGKEHFGVREQQMLKELGFETAVTTVNLNINSFTSSNFFVLPRIALGMSMTEKSFEFILNGFLPMRRNHFLFKV